MINYNLKELIIVIILALVEVLSPATTFAKTFAKQCAWWEFWCEPYQAPLTDDPSKEEIIEAVRRSVAGKTYAISTTRYNWEIRYCTYFDVSSDIYMPRNPELARCPYVGKSYHVTVPVQVTETRSCRPLPSPQEYGWRVQQTGRDRWQVSYMQGVWDVEKLAGRGAIVAGHIAIGRFTFAIQAHQQC